MSDFLGQCDVHGMAYPCPRCPAPAAPPATRGCACRARDAQACADARCGEDSPVGLDAEPCLCSCHEELEDGHDDA